MLTKLKLAWHILCGKPVMYRMHLVPGPGMVNLSGVMRDAQIVDCVFEGRSYENDGIRKSWMDTPEIRLDA
jgi:hypothetical protein